MTALDLTPAEARVAELEQELAESKAECVRWETGGRIAPLKIAAEALMECEQWKAHANALRDALEMVSGSCTCGCHGRADEALATTPRANLAAYRASVLEEAAALADKASHESGAQGYSGGPKYVDMTKLAAAIRALAAQEDK